MIIPGIINPQDLVDSVVLAESRGPKVQNGNRGDAAWVEVRYTREGRLLVRTWWRSTYVHFEAESISQPEFRYMREGQLRAHCNRHHVPLQRHLIQWPAMPSPELVLALAKPTGGWGWWGMFDRRTPQEVALVTEYVFNGFRQA